MSENGSKKGRRPNEGNKPLDLGIAAILSAREGEDEAISSVTAPTATPPSPEPEPAKRAESQYEKLARGGKWRELVQVTDSEIGRAGESADPIDARLWWIRGHLEAGSMPVSFLAAPLEAVCRRLKKGGVPEDLAPWLVSTAEAVVSRLERQLGSAEHVASLRAAMLACGYPLEGHSEATGAAQGAQRPAGGAGSASREQRGPTEFSAAAGAAEGVSTRAPQLEGRWQRKTVLACGALALASVGYGLVWWGSVGLFAATVPAAEGFVRDARPLEQLNPVLERRDPVGSLGALFYTIDTKGSTPSNGGAGPVASATDSAGGPERGGRSPVAARNRGKERINTRSPVESPELQERLRRRERREPADRGRREPIPIPNSGSGGDPFDPGGVFRVLTRTSVLAAPSYSAEVVGKLEPGDRVFVEARLGRWVRLRSKRGRGGFVLADDVSEIPPGQ
jgi:hypothetical protein